MKKLKDLLQEDIPTNNVSDGNIDGIGVGDKGEPGINKKKKRIKELLLKMIRRRNDRSTHIHI